MALEQRGAQLVVLHRADVLVVLPPEGEKLFGVRLCFNEKVGPTGKKIAIASWSNYWQMMDIVLTLRGLGYAAVKMFYSGRKKLVPTGRGVEENIRVAVKSKFGVVLDWSATLA